MLDNIEIEYICSFKLNLICYNILDKNECLSLPCANDGTCMNTAGSYTCECKEGWTGQDCKEGMSHFFYL